MWSKDQRCEEVIKNIWNGQGAGVPNKLVAMKGLEEHFKEYHIGEVSRELGIIEKFLNDKKNWEASLESIKMFKALDSQRNSLVQVEEIMWRQRSHAVWLKHDD